MLGMASAPKRGQVFEDGLKRLLIVSILLAPVIFRDGLPREVDHPDCAGIQQHGDERGIDFPVRRLRVSSCGHGCTEAHVA